MVKLFSFFGLLLISFHVCAQNSTMPNADKLFETEGEIYFALPGARSQVNALSRIIGVDHVKGDTIFAYANKSEYQNLLATGLNELIVLPHPGDVDDVAMSNDPRQVLEWNYYPTYEGYESIMQQFADDYPGLCELVTIGILPSGRKLLALHISDNVGTPEAEPEFLYTATIHGDETTGYILMLHLADYLLSNYNQDPRVTQIVNGIDLWINPLANPDGTYAGGNNTVNGARRYNSNFVDLNRNYPDPEDGPHPDGNSWQPETVAFMNFAEEYHFVMSANFHGGAEVVNYPWDTWSRLHADNDWYVMISREYADTAQANSPSGYMTGYDNGITNGYDWYSISGGRQDYMNYFQQCREVTMEISNTKLLPASKLIAHWNYNYRSLLNYIEQVSYGIRGVVTDTISGAPVNAQVFINGHDLDSSMVFCGAALGDYYRPLKAGTYSISYFAEGYLPKTISNVSITDYNQLVRNVKLWNGSAIPAFMASDTLIPPGREIQFTDLSGGSPNQWLWTFEGADNPVSTQPNPKVIYSTPGTYSVTLYVANNVGGNQLVKQEYITVAPGYYIGMQGGSVCNTMFYDSQGPVEPYLSDEDLVTTFFSSNPDKVLRISFSAFNIEPGEACVNDALYIYDGPDVNSPLLARLCGTDLPDDVYGSEAGGALTFRFVSNSFIQAEGWSAVIHCVDVVHAGFAAQDDFKVFPNPVINGLFVVKADQPIVWIKMYTPCGSLVCDMQPSKNDCWVDVSGLNPGIYFLSVYTSNGMKQFKVMVTR